MKFQQLEYTCGPSCVVNAARCLGIKIREQDVRTFSNTDLEHGTHESDLIMAMWPFGLTGEFFTEDSDVEAWDHLTEYLRSGVPVICVVDPSSPHYVTAIGTIGQRVVVFDGKRVKRTRQENGCFVYSKAEFMKRWSHVGLHVGIAVKKK